MNVRHSLYESAVIIKQVFTDGCDRWRRAVTTEEQALAWARPLQGH